MTELGTKLVELYKTIKIEGLLTLMNEENNSEAYWAVVNSLSGAEKTRFIKVADMVAYGNSVKEIKQADKFFRVNKIGRKELDVFFDTLISYISNPIGHMRWNKLTVKLITMYATVESLQKKLDKING